jgi:hypothetical protein
MIFQDKDLSPLLVYFAPFVQSYASILYLRVPYVFRMILRGKEIERHNIINDMMLKNQVTYKPIMSNGYPNDTEVKTMSLFTYSFVYNDVPRIQLIT